GLALTSHNGSAITTAAFSGFAVAAGPSSPSNPNPGQPNPEPEPNPNPQQPDTTPPPATPPPSGDGLVFHVATYGNDGSDGSSGSPFATIARARDAIRAATGRTDSGGEPQGNWRGATVVIRGGAYWLKSPLTFDTRDSGTESDPVDYQAASGETVIISGAYPVPDDAWELVSSSSEDSFAWSRLPASSRGKVYRLDVGALGLWKGSIEANYHGITDWLAPIVGGKRRQMARWRNGDITEAPAWSIMEDVHTDGGASGDSRFVIGSGEPGSWDWSGKELLTYGYWSADWLPSWENVKGIWNDGSGRSAITIGPRGTDYPLNDALIRRMFFANLLQHLDDPGAFVWNHGRGILYYLPDSGAGAPTGASLTWLHTTIQNGARWPNDWANAASWIRFRSLIVEGARNKILHSQDADGVVLENCVFRNGTGSGVFMRGGYKHEIIGGTVTDVMRSGIEMLGVGDIHNYSDGQCVIDGVTIERCGWFAQE
ncbi:MAG: right-handed parallel beta-helix repeat-containing protein, partial [Opitutaceae bacterium]